MYIVGFPSTYVAVFNCIYRGMFLNDIIFGVTSEFVQAKHFNSFFNTYHTNRTALTHAFTNSRE